MKTDFIKQVQIDFPVIMAPMFLVSNESMVKAAMDEGIMGTFPTLNYRKDGELETILDNLNNHKNSGSKGSYGVNLIVQKTNPLFDKHMAICVSKKVPFYITSLGSPKVVIEEAHKYGAIVYSDVTNLEHAKKCADLGVDGFIAVGQGAGGHAGPYPLQLLIPSLKKEFPDIPVVSAGGVSSGAGILSMIALGAAGVSIGTHFIATKEAGVNEAYKNAIVEAKMGDIVMTNKISGTPCAIINTPYAQKIGYQQNWLERALSNNQKTKKYFKMLVQLRGMQKLEQSIKPANYQTLWCAGQSVELIDKVSTVKEVIQNYKQEFITSFGKLTESD